MDFPQVHAGGALVGLSVFGDGGFATLAPLEVQIWGVPFECFTTKLSHRLGSALGETTTPTLHRSDISGGLYFRDEPVFDLTAELSDEIAVDHVVPSKGHIGANCPRKAELEGVPPRYGTFTISKETGPPIMEKMMARRKNKFNWLRAVSQRPSSSHPSGFKLTRPPASGMGRTRAVGAHGDSVWEDTRRPTHGRMGGKDAATRSNCMTNSCY
ncbi:unnamed protein product [Linum tenue]|uniref:Uncharacterized protein n=1 Tax=Linum tenue TaxID=586396 RepID=A0AAV0Q4R4_9ROSI|nr:unnamed protein product [Linum tenue]